MNPFKFYHRGSWPGHGSWSGNQVVRNRSTWARGQAETPRKGFTSERIIRLLKEAEILIGEGSTTKEAVRRIGVSEQTFYKWRREYGGLRVDQARRLKELEKENARLKRLVADKELDIHILKEALDYESKNG